MGEWTLFSNHGHVLVCLANNNEARLRDVAAAVGITERAVQNILRELQQAGIVQISKHGRCNRYQINTRKSLRHPLEAHCSVGKLLSLLKSTDNEIVKPEPLVARKPAPVKSPIAKVAVAQPAEPKPILTKPDSQPISKPAEPEIVAARDLADDRVAEVRAEVVAVEVVREASRKPTEDKPAAREVEKKAAEDTPTAKETGKKVTKDDVPPSTPQGSLF